MYQNGLDNMNSDNFLWQERKILRDTLLQIAVKIRDKIKESGNNYLLTQRNNTIPILDSLYGYVYGKGDDMDVYEREVKGFRITSNGELLICMDLSCVQYDLLALEETYENIDDNVWYPILQKDLFTGENDCLVITDSFNIYLTLLSISENIYQYFD